MNSPVVYVLAATLVMGVATQITRFFPFALFSRREPPRWLLQSARLIPGAVMTVLLLSCLPLNLFSGALPQTETLLPWLGVALVALLHLRFRHPLLSIFGGTAFYMLLLQWGG